MIPTRNLIIRLQERSQALFQAPDANFGSQIRFFVTWLEKEPYLSATLASLPKPQLEPEAWLQQKASGTRQSLDVSLDEAEAVGELWYVIKHVAAQDDVDGAVFRITVDFVHGTGLRSEDFNRGFLDIFVEPVLTWLKERLLADDVLLNSLERYAREAAWFRRDELRAAYELDTSRGEAVLDRDLRHHLFRDGIDFPFSEPRIPSGKPDIVVPDENAEPIPLEVKVYDPAKGRDDKWVRSGFAQAIEYANDYRRADSYLAVFDVSLEGLAIASDDLAHLPTIRASGVTVFIIVIPVGPTQAASRRQVAKRLTLDGDFLRATSQDA